VLNGFPEHCEKTPEGWGVFHDYRESEPGYVPASAVADAAVAS